MAEMLTQRKVARVLGKGQVTIPSEFRATLGIDRTTLLSISLVGDHLEIKPLRSEEEELRRYSDADMARFLEEDKLDEKTARRVRGLLGRGAL